MQGAESYQETSIMDEFSTSGMSDISDNNSLLLNLNSSHENLTAMEPKLALFVCLITTSISLVTTAGNILVIIAFYMNKRLQTITNYFILSLAYADMVIGLVSMNLFTIYIVQGEWNLGPLVCDIWLCIDYVACNASVMNLLIISVDRYLALTKPMTYRVKRTKRRACLMIVGAWTVSFILWVPSILLWPLVEGGRNVQNKKCYIRFILASPAVAIGTAMAAFYVPVLVMSILSWYINRVNVEHRKYANTFRIRKSTNEKNIGQYSVNKTLNGTRSSAMSDRIKERNTQGVKVWKMRRNQNNTLEEDEHNKENGSKIQPPLAVIKVETSSFDQLGQEPHKDEITIEKSKSSFRLSETTASLLNATRQNVRNMSARENKAARMLLCIMVVFIITWAPYNILVVISTVCGEDGCVNDILWKLSYWLCYLNSTINPACYAMCSPEFRRTFHRLLRCQRSNDLFRTKTSLKPFARAAALSVGENLTTVQ